MTNEVMDRKVEYDVNGEKVELTPNMIKNYLVSGNAEVEMQEIVMFMKLAQFQHLNPFLNEVYLVKFKGSPAQIITSKEAFMKRAESNPHYRGFKAGVIVKRENEIKNLDGAFMLETDTLLGGWSEIRRDDRDLPITVEISMKEFGKGQATWKNMPANMIRKTAIVNALREAFPETLGGMYTEDDKNPHEAPINVMANEVDETKPKSVDELIGDEIDGERPIEQSETSEQSENAFNI